MQNFSDFFDKNFKKAVLLTLGALIFFLIISALANVSDVEIKKSNSFPQTTITGHGEAFVKAVPDIATFNFTVRVEEKLAKNAQQKMTEITNKALSILDQNGVTKKDIKTENYSTFPRYDFQNFTCSNNICPPAKQILRGFEASQTISVKVHNLEKAGDILSLIAEAGVTEVSGLSFEVDNVEELQKKARSEAIIKAKEEAEATAKALGVSLKRIVRFNEGSVGGAFGVMRNSKAMAFAAADAAMESPRIEAGTEKITASVSITYEF